MLQNPCWVFSQSRTFAADVSDVYTLIDEVPSSPSIFDQPCRRQYGLGGCHSEDTYRCPGYSCITCTRSIGGLTSCPTVLHPIAGFLALLCFIAALAQALRPMIPHAIPICTLLISIIPAVATTVVFVIDIVLVVVARAKVEEATNNGLTVNWGNAVWMTAGSIVAMWLSVIGLSAVACGCFGYGRIGYISPTFDSMCGSLLTSFFIQILRYMMRKKRRTPNEKEDQSPDFYVPGKVPDGILVRPSSPT